jgi:predicted enzyme related to lactoylglutathione lyase
VTSGINNIAYPAGDLAAAKTLFTALLGIEPYVDAPYYVGYRPADGPEIGLDPNAKDGPICYWEVADITATLETLLAAGATAERPVSDVGGGKLVATVRDPAGSILGISQSPA